MSEATVDPADLRAPDDRASEIPLREDIRRIRTHPLVPDDVVIGGFIYDVDTGLLDQRI